MLLKLYRILVVIGFENLQAGEVGIACLEDVRFLLCRASPYLFLILNLAQLSFVLRVRLVENHLVSEYFGLNLGI